MSPTDMVEAGTLAVAAFGYLAGALNRWSVANHRDRLAVFTSGAANAAGRIADAVKQLPAGADVNAIKSTLVAHAAEVLLQNYGETAEKLGADTAAAASTISGQLGQITLPAPTAMATWAMPQAIGASSKRGIPDVQP